MNWLRTRCERWFPTIDPARTVSRRHSLPLDGVRGLAILLVLSYDSLKLPSSGNPLTFAARKFASCGWAGVDLFFVLSGFLITGILLDTVGRPHYWRSFLSRRSLRIFPLYFATLIGVFLVLPLFRSQLPVATATALDAVGKDQVWYWCYGQNWLYAWRGAWPDERVLNHFWSLAIEEQFYLVWPLVVCLTTRRRLLWLCLGLSGLALALRCVLLSLGVPSVATYVMTVTRLDSLCLGAIVSILVRDPEFVRRFGRWLPRAAAVSLATLIALDALWPVLRSQTVAACSVGHSLLAVSFSALIGSCALVPEGHLLARGFSWRPLLILGKYSYAIYVFHRFVYAIVLDWDWSSIPEPLRGWSMFLATCVGSLLVAITSWHLLERPCLSWKELFPRPDEFDDRAVAPEESEPSPERSSSVSSAKEEIAVLRES